MTHLNSRQEYAVRDDDARDPTFTHSREGASIGVVRIADAALPTQYGDFQAAVFSADGVPGEVLVLMHGADEGLPLVRLHSECLTGDTLGSLRCDCGPQLQMALERIAQAPRGILLYLPQEGRGIGLSNKIRAYALQDRGLDTVDANVELGLPVDSRDYAPAAAILRSMSVHRVRLLTNNPAKGRALEQNGVQVVERLPLIIPPNPNNLGYLNTKANRMGHLITLLEPGT